MMRFTRCFLWCFALFIAAMSSCKKDQLLTSGGELRFSADTLLFDTVFTSLGSATYKIKIYNPQDKPVKISSVRLEQGDKSPFKLNVNGIPGNNVADQEIAAHDSMYVFSIVQIDPTSSTSPFVVEDKLVATLNGRDFSVPVIAYGQNAHYIYDSTLSTQTWGSDLPYVIINNAAVDTGATLTIQKGCRIHLHADSRLFVAGTLIVEGEKEDSVVFLSDRIDRSYFGYMGTPGEWGGLYFTSSSKGNKLRWTVLKNCGNSTMLNGQFVQPAAIQVDNNPSITEASGQLQMDNCIVENSIGFGLLSFGGAVQMRNCMINTCGGQNVGVSLGGNYYFENCTFVTYGTLFVGHSDANVMTLTNFLDISQTEFHDAPLNFTMKNSIVYGSLTREFLYGKKGTSAFNINLENCLLRMDMADVSSSFVNCIYNEDPKFKDYAKWDYHLDEGSPAAGKGLPVVGSINLDGMLRPDPVTGYNIGAY
jgi:hypothetical protein